MKKKKTLSLLIMMAFLITSALPTAVFADPKTEDGKETIGVQAFDEGKPMIERWKQAKKLVGYPSGHYGMDRHLTRAEFAAFLTRIVIIQERADLSPYTDVSPSDWFYDSLAKAVAKEYVVGKSATTMAPNEVATAEEVIAIAMRIHDLYKNIDASANSKILKEATKNASDWSKDAMKDAIAKGIMKVDEKGNPEFTYQQPINRHDMIKILDRVMEGRRIITVPGEYKFGKVRNLMILSGDVTIKDTEVTENLYIPERSSDKEMPIVLENVDIKGEKVIEKKNHVIEKEEKTPKDSKTGGTKKGGYIGGPGESHHDKESPEEKAIVKSVTAVAEPATVSPGEKSQLSAKVRGVNLKAKDQKVTWRLDPSKTYNAETQVSAEGILTVGANEEATTINVIATSVTDPSVQTTVTVKVMAKPVLNPVVKQVTVDAKSTTVHPGETVKLTAVVTGDNLKPGDKAVSWKLKDGETYAANTAVDAEGNLTIADDETADRITVVATSVINPSISGEKTFNVREALAPDVQAALDKLQKLIDDNQELLNSNDNALTKAALKEALDKAQAVADKDNPTVDELNKANKELSDFLKDYNRRGPMSYFPSFDNLNLKDGVYIGNGGGFYSVSTRPMKARITVENGQIVAAELEHFGDDSGLYKQAATGKINKINDSLAKKDADAKNKWVTDLHRAFEYLRATVDPRSTHPDYTEPKPVVPGISSEKEAMDVIGWEEADARSGATYSVSGYTRALVDAMNQAFLAAKDMESDVVAVLFKDGDQYKETIDTQFVAVGDTFDPASITIGLKKKDGSIEEVPFAKWEEKGISTTLKTPYEAEESNQTVKVTIKHKLSQRENSYTIYTKEKERPYVSPVSIEYAIGNSDEWVALDNLKRIKEGYVPNGYDPESLAFSQKVTLPNGSKDQTIKFRFLDADNKVMPYTPESIQFDEVKEYKFVMDKALFASQYPDKKFQYESFYLKIKEEEATNPEEKPFVSPVSIEYAIGDSEHWVAFENLKTIKDGTVPKGHNPNSLSPDQNVTLPKGTKTKSIKIRFLDADDKVMPYTPANIQFDEETSYQFDMDEALFASQYPDNRYQYKTFRLTVHESEEAAPVPVPTDFHVDSVKLIPYYEGNPLEGQGNAKTIEVDKNLSEITEDIRLNLPANLSKKSLKYYDKFDLIVNYKQGDTAKTAKKELTKDNLVGKQTVALESGQLPVDIFHSKATFDKIEYTLVDHFEDEPAADAEWVSITPLPTAEELDANNGSWAIEIPIDPSNVGKVLKFRHELTYPDEYKRSKFTDLQLGKKGAVTLANNKQMAGIVYTSKPIDENSENIYNYTLKFVKGTVPQPPAPQPDTLHIDSVKVLPYNQGTAIDTPHYSSSKEVDKDLTDVTDPVVVYLGNQLNRKDIKNYEKFDLIVNYKKGSESKTATEQVTRADLFGKKTIALDGGEIPVEVKHSDPTFDKIEYTLVDKYDDEPAADAEWVSITPLPTVDEFENNEHAVDITVPVDPAHVGKVLKFRHKLTHPDEYKRSDTTETILKVPAVVTLADREPMTGILYGSQAIEGEPAYSYKLKFVKKAGPQPPAPQPETLHIDSVKVLPYYKEKAADYEHYSSSKKVDKDLTDVTDPVVVYLGNQLNRQEINNYEKFDLIVNYKKGSESKTATEQVTRADLFGKKTIALDGGEIPVEVKHSDPTFDKIEYTLVDKIDDEPAADAEWVSITPLPTVEEFENNYYAADITVPVDPAHVGKVLKFRHKMTHPDEYKRSGTTETILKVPSNVTLADGEPMAGILYESQEIEGDPAYSYKLKFVKKAGPQPPAPQPEDEKVTYPDYKTVDASKIKKGSYEGTTDQGYTTNPTTVNLDVDENQGFRFSTKVWGDDKALYKTQAEKLYELLNGPKYQDPNAVLRLGQEALHWKKNVDKLRKLDSDEKMREEARRILDVQIDDNLTRENVEAPLKEHYKKIATDENRLTDIFDTCTGATRSGAAIAIAAADAMKVAIDSGASDLRVVKVEYVPNSLEKTAFEPTDTLDLTGLKVKVMRNDQSEETIAFPDFAANNLMVITKNPGEDEVEITDPASISLEKYRSQHAFYFAVKEKKSGRVSEKIKLNVEVPKAQLGKITMELKAEGDDTIYTAENLDALEEKIVLPETLKGKIIKVKMKTESKVWPTIPALLSVNGEDPVISVDEGNKDFVNTFTAKESELNFIYRTAQDTKKELEALGFRDDQVESKDFSNLRWFIISFGDTNLTVG